MYICTISYILLFQKSIKYICKTPALSQFMNNEKPDLVALQHTSVDFLTDQIKTLIYQRRSKEMANNHRNGSAKGKISGTER
jgi:hypothetical protein